jgi:hypothetical protein
MLIRRDALTPHNRLINSMFLKFTPVKWRARCDTYRGLSFTHLFDRLRDLLFLVTFRVVTEISTDRNGARVFRVNQFAVRAPTGPRDFFEANAFQSFQQITNFLRHRSPCFLLRPTVEFIGRRRRSAGMNG